MSYTSAGILFYGIPLPTNLTYDDIDDHLFGKIKLVSFGNAISGDEIALALHSKQVSIHDGPVEIDFTKMAIAPDTDEKFEHLRLFLNTKLDASKQIPYIKPHWFLTASYS